MEMHFQEIPYDPETPVFSAESFLSEVRRGTNVLGVEYCEDTAMSILQAYSTEIPDGVVQIRASSRPGEPLVYRLYPSTPRDGTRPAIMAGMLDPCNPRIPLVKSWLELYPKAYGNPDFESGKGFCGAFIFFGVNTEGGLRPLDEILDAPNVPAYITKNRALLHDNGLSIVQSARVEYHTGCIEFYFVVLGPLTKDLAARFTALAGAEPPSDFLYDEMSTMLGPGNFFLGVVFDDKGTIIRVDFYILFPIELPGGRMPDLPKRLHEFWEIDTYAEEEMDILAWSFGRDLEQPYIQAERTFTGNLRNLWRSWGIMTVE